MKAVGSAEKPIAELHAASIISIRLPSLSFARMFLADGVKSNLISQGRSEELFADVVALGVPESIADVVMCDGHYHYVDEGGVISTITIDSLAQLHDIAHSEDERWQLTPDAAARVHEKGVSVGLPETHKDDELKRSVIRLEDSIASLMMALQD